jgi:hypothetical protein
MKQTDSSGLQSSKPPTMVSIVFARIAVVKQGALESRLKMTTKTTPPTLLLSEPDAATVAA